MLPGGLFLSMQLGIFEQIWNKIREIVEDEYTHSGLKEGDGMRIGFSLLVILLVFLGAGLGLAARGQVMVR